MTEILPYVTGSAGALVVLAFVAWGFYTGKLHSDREFGREVKRADTLEQALKEGAQALADATKRADAAVRASELIADAFSEARSRRATRSSAGRRNDT